MRWSRFFRRQHWNDERARELDAYLAEETADNIARGMTPEQAKYAANRKLGNAVQIREEIFRMNSLGFIETLWHDIRYGTRVLLKSPGFTLVAILSLALGIGATTAMFSVIYGVLIAPFPYANPGEIWAPLIYRVKNPKDERFIGHMRDYVEMKKLPVFSEVMGTSPESRLLGGERARENFRAIQVSGNAFHFLGVPAIVGRTLQPSDIRADGQPEPVIVLTYKAWQKLFNGELSAIGKTIVLDDQKITVVGVMPPRFGWWTDDGGWMPFADDARDSRMVFPIVRLKPGVTAQAAQAQLQTSEEQLAKAHPADFPKDQFSTRLNNYLKMTVTSGTEMESSLRLLFGAVGFLLLIACANVANLQLARGTARSQEIAVRISIGARRGRIFRQLLTESVLLSLLGGIGGVLLAIGITRGTAALMPDYAIPNEARITVNVYVLMFSAAVSVLTGILFGLIPALKASRPDVVDALKEAGRTNAGSVSSGQTRKALVIAEIALSVVLLTGASLTIRGFVQLQNTNLGFQSERVLMVGLQAQPKHYTTYDQRIALTARILASVDNLPGAESATIGNGGFPFGGPRSTFSIDGQTKDDSKVMFMSLVSTGYAKTMGIPLKAGRELTEQEVARAEPVALINETAAKLFRQGVNPIGQRIHLDVLEKPQGMLQMPSPTRPNLTVVGIMADTRNDGPGNPTAPAAFMPYTLAAPPFRMLAIRSRTDPMLLLNSVRERLGGIDRDLALSRPTTVEEQVGQAVVQPRFNMALFTFFGLLGLALAAVGIYSMLSYSVVRRTHELGIRMALGASRKEVLGLVLAMGGRLVGIGLVIGLVASVVLGRVLRSEVFHAAETDPIALSGVVVVLGAIALLACFVPALRASRLDPMSALRHD